MFCILYFCAAVFYSLSVFEHRQALASARAGPPAALLWLLNGGDTVGQKLHLFMFDL